MILSCTDCIMQSGVSMSTLMKFYKNICIDTWNSFACIKRLCILHNVSNNILKEKGMKLYVRDQICFIRQDFFFLIFKIFLLEGQLFEVTAIVLTLNPRKLVPSFVAGAGRWLCTTVRTEFRALIALLKISSNSSITFTGSLFTCCKGDDKGICNAQNLATAML